MRILLIKLTSMGDLIHVLPALTDAMRANPSLSFDWVIEKSFSEIATWHPAVKNIIPTSHREWKKHLWQSLKNGEIKNFVDHLRKEKYDLVIDGQASIKSALIGLFSKGIRVGLDKQSARESIASYAYQKKYAVDKKYHALTRLRLLFSLALQYPYPTTKPDYGILSYPFPPIHFNLPTPYVVYIHNASWETKLLPENHWHQLIGFAAKKGFHVLLPWGNISEKERAERLAKNHRHAYVLPFCSLSEHAVILKNAAGVIACDTGLSHLSAALNVKTLTLYGPTSTHLIGTIGQFQRHTEPDFACTQCYQRYCHYNKAYHPESLCMVSNSPTRVWESFETLLQTEAPLV